MLNDGSELRHTAINANKKTYRGQIGDAIRLQCPFPFLAIENTLTTLSNPGPMGIQGTPDHHIGQRENNDCSLA